MKRVSNMDELAKALLPTIQKMADQMAERVYETLNYFLQEYILKTGRKVLDFC